MLEELKAQRRWHESLAERVTGFIGRPHFVAIHVLWFVFWIVVNLVIGYEIPHIDNVAHLGGLISGLLLGFIPHRLLWRSSRCVPGPSHVLQARQRRALPKERLVIVCQSTGIGVPWLLRSRRRAVRRSKRSEFAPILFVFHGEKTLMRNNRPVA